MSKPLFLKIYKNQQIVGVKQFRTNQIVLGSGDVDVQLEGLSFIHAIIQKTSDSRCQIVVEAGVEPGLFINGQQVQKHILSSRDIFQIGIYQIEFFEGVASLTSAQQPPTPPVPPQQQQVVPPTPPVPPQQQQVVPPTPPVPPQQQVVPPTPPVPPQQQQVAPPAPPMPPQQQQVVPPTPPVPPQQQQVVPPTPPVPQQQQQVAPPAPPVPPQQQQVVPPTPPVPPQQQQIVPPTPPVPPQQQQIVPPASPVPPQQQQVVPKQTPLILSEGMPHSAQKISEDTEVSVTETFVPEALQTSAVPPASSVLSQPEDMQVMPQKQKAEATSSQDRKRSYRKKRTYAPPSDVKDINERVVPERGSVVQVLVAWRERILDTLYFDSRQTVRVGSHPKNDIVLPIFGDAQDSHPLIKIKSLASLFITYEMRGVLVKGKQRIAFDEMIRSGAASRSDKGFNIDLQQGELAKVEFENDLSIFVKYVAPSPKPIIGPFFDLTAKELNALVMAVGSSIIMAIFFLISYETIEPEIQKEEELERKAIFVYQPPPRPPIDPVPVRPKPKPKPQRVKPVQVKKAPPKRVKVDMAKKVQKKAPTKKVAVKKKARSKNKGLVAKAGKEGKRPSKVRTKAKSNKLANNTGSRKRKSPRGGGGGARAAGRKQKDVSKSGLLGVFGKAGAQDQLRTAFDGAGVVGGIAQKARGSGGSVAGSGGGLSPGGGLAAVGKGGRGERTYGISGVQTKGGSGFGNKGSGDGLGGKANVRVVPGGDGESFVGVMDKDAIRRVVKRNLAQLKNCYERLAQRRRESSGRVELGWDIHSGGRVGSVKIVSSQIKDQKMLNCMKLRLASWRFPDPPEGVIGEVTYPFVFALSRQ